MHHCKVSMDLEFCLSEQQFSLDILVIKLSELFHSRAFCQILRLFEKGAEKDRQALLERTRRPR